MKILKTARFHMQNEQLCHRMNENTKESVRWHQHNVVSYSGCTSSSQYCDIASQGINKNY